MVKTEKIKVRTRGNCDIVNITDRVSKIVADSEIDSGIVTLFNVGSTAGITTTEYEYQNEYRIVKTRTTC